MEAQDYYNLNQKKSYILNILWILSTFFLTNAVFKYFNVFFFFLVGGGVGGVGGGGEGGLNFEEGI